MLLIHRAPTSREAAIRGWWLGCGYFVAAMYWLAPEIGPAVILVAIVFGALLGPFGKMIWVLLRPPVTVPRALAALVIVPSYWLVTEWLRSWQALGGPWAVLGASQWQHPAVLALAAVGGVWLVSVAIVAVNVAVLIAIVAGRLRPGWWLPPRPRPCWRPGRWPSRSRRRPPRRVPRRSRWCSRGW